MSPSDRLGELLRDVVIPTVKLMPVTSPDHRKVFMKWAEAWPAAKAYHECMLAARMAESSLQEWAAIAGSRLAQGRVADCIAAMALTRCEATKIKKIMGL